MAQPVPGYPAGVTVIRQAQPMVAGQVHGQVTYAGAPTSPKVISAAGAPRVITASTGSMPMQVTSPTAGQVIRQVIQPGQMISPTATRTVVAGAPGGVLQAGAVHQVGTAPATTIIRPTSTTIPPGAAMQTLSGSVVRVAAGAPTTTVTRAAPMVVQQPGGQAVRPNVVAGPTYTQASYEQKHQKDDTQLQNLKELRKSSGLRHIPVGDGLATLKALAVDGKLTREQFVEAYAELLQGHGVEVPTDSVKNAVFDLFDRDDNNVVDMMELICGISLLCAGTEDEKIHAVFNVFDENGDGFISMDEMFKFLTSVFKVVLTPNVMSVMNAMGVTVESAEDLASVTSLECFKTADLNHDGKLSVTEFKNWFYAPRNDPAFLFSPVRKLLQ